MLRHTGWNETCKQEYRLFLIYINDLHNSVKSSTVYYFPDDTSFLYTNESLKKINISTESKDHGLALIISGQKVSLQKKVKYLGIMFDEQLDWTEYLLPQLNKVIGLSSKIRHYLSKPHLKTFYFSLFKRHLFYACLIWANQKLFGENFRFIKKSYESHKFQTFHTSY